MSYYVVWPDGRRFGPADLPTLQTWADDGRITPDTQIEDSVAGQTTPASIVPGLVFEAAPPPVPPSAGMPLQEPAAEAPGPSPNLEQIGSGNPYSMPPGAGAPYPRASTEKLGGASELTTAWVLYALSFVCGCGCISQVPGLIVAYQAKQKGHPGAQVAVVVGWVLVAVTAVGVAVVFLTNLI